MDWFTVLLQIILAVVGIVASVLAAKWARQKVLKKESDKRKDEQNQDIIKDQHDQKDATDAYHAAEHYMKRLKRYREKPPQIIFKVPRLEKQFHELHPRMKEIGYFFADLSLAYGIVPICTRVTDPVEGSSGVHEAGRGLDFRDQFSGGRLYTAKQKDSIVKMMNKTYKRLDGRLVCIHHSFQSGPEHFHLQIPIAWVS